MRCELKLSLPSMDSVFSHKKVPTGCLFAQKLSDTVLINFNMQKKFARKQVFKLLLDKEVWQGAALLPQDELQDPDLFFSPSIPPTPSWDSGGLATLEHILVSRECETVVVTAAQAS